MSVLQQHRDACVRCLVALYVYTCMHAREASHVSSRRLPGPSACRRSRSREHQIGNPPGMRSVWRWRLLKSGYFNLPLMRWRGRHHIGTSHALPTTHAYMPNLTPSPPPIARSHVVNSGHWLNDWVRSSTAGAISRSQRDMEATPTGVDPAPHDRSSIACRM